MGFKSSANLPNTTVLAVAAGGVPAVEVTLSNNTLLDNSHADVYLNVVDGCTLITLGPVANFIGKTFHVHVDEAFTARSLNINPDGVELLGRKDSYNLGPSAYLQFRPNAAGTSWDVLAATYASVDNNDDLAIELARDDRMVVVSDDPSEHIGDQTASFEDVAKGMNSVIGRQTPTGNFTAFAPRSYYCDLNSESRVILENCSNAARQRIVITVANESPYGLTVKSEGTGPTVGDIDYYMPPGSQIELESDGSNWVIVTKTNVFVADISDIDTWVPKPNTDQMDGVAAMATDGGSLVLALYFSGTNRIIVSTDGGRTFTIPTLPVVKAWSKVAYGNGRFLVTLFGQGTDTLMTTTDFITWNTFTDSGLDDVYNITMGASSFVALTDDGVGGFSSFKSTLGDVWVQGGSLNPSKPWEEIAGGGGRVVAIAKIHSGSIETVAYSTDDGDNWNTTNFTHTRDHGKLSYADGHFLTMAQNDAGQDEVSMSTDGNFWFVRVMPSDLGYAFAYDGVLLMCVGNTVMYYSDDQGVSWSTVTTVPAAGQIYPNVISADAGFIASNSAPTVGNDKLFTPFLIGSARPILSDALEPFTAPPQVPTYLVADLPAGTETMIAYASDGRKNGEAPAAGTGVLVFFDGTDWIASDSGVVVAA